MITIAVTELRLEQRKYALRMLKECVGRLQGQDSVNRELLQDAANWAVIAEALGRRT
ncbi:hypothetical protein [Streptomyces sp. NPDC007205]|uniref:hypothetical protein n=1 Tax=Streptomyces sp. NPDC007205 TaxID=3154316 RepID=UPI0033C2E79C